MVHCNYRLFPVGKKSLDFLSPRGIEVRVGIALSFYGGKSITNSNICKVIVEV